MNSSPEPTGTKQCLAQGTSSGLSVVFISVLTVNQTMYKSTIYMLTVCIVDLCRGWRPC